MPKMRILSGAQAGGVVEMSLVEAQAAYCTGYAELAEPETAAETPPKRSPEPPVGASPAKGKASERKRRGR